MNWESEVGGMPMSSRREISSKMRSSVVRECDIDWAMRLYNIFKEGGLVVKRGGHVMYPG